MCRRHTAACPAASDNWDKEPCQCSTPEGNCLHGSHRCCAGHSRQPPLWTCLMRQCRSSSAGTSIDPLGAWRQYRPRSRQKRGCEWSGAARGRAGPSGCSFSSATASVGKTCLRWDGQGSLHLQSILISGNNKKEKWMLRPNMLPEDRELHLSFLNKGWHMVILYTYIVQNHNILYTYCVQNHHHH